MRVFSFDFETSLIQPYMQAPPIVCMSFAVDDREPELVHVKERRFWERLWTALNDPDCVLVAHNAAYEITCLLAATAGFPAWRRAIFGALRAGRFKCTLLRDRLIRIGRGIMNEDLALDDCMTFNHLPHKLDKKCWWRLRYGTLFDVPVAEWPKEAVDYAIGDTCVRELFVSQARPEYKRFLVTANAELEADVFLRLSQCWGFTTDHDRAVALYAKVQELIERDRVLLAQEGLIELVRAKGVLRWKKDTKEAKLRLTAAYEALGAVPPRGDVSDKMVVAALKLVGVEAESDGKDPTKSDIADAIEIIEQFLQDKPEQVAKAMELMNGNISLNEESCYGCRSPIMESYTRFAQASTLFSKVKRLQFPIIQASIFALGCDTGRTSCTQGSEPDPGEAWMNWGLQLQNPPRAPGVRECLRARIRHAIVSCDFDTFELRTLTQQAYRLHLENPELHPYPLMRDVLMDPTRDVHVELGALVYGITVAEAYALKKTNKALFKDLRQVAKALNFGAPGGLGAETFVEFARMQYDVILTKERAAELIEIWKTKWPEMRAYLEWAGKELRAQDPKAYKEKRQARGESIIFGTEMVRGSTTYCNFCNNQFQGLAAAAAKAGFVALGYAMYNDEDSGVFGCRMVVFLHDEVLLEIPLETLHVTSHRARDIFVAGAQAIVPDVTLTSSPAACYNWSKSAGDPVFDKNGELMVWEEYVVSEVQNTGKFSDYEFTEFGDPLTEPVKEKDKLNVEMVAAAFSACHVRFDEAQAV